VEIARNTWYLHQWECIIFENGLTDFETITISALIMKFNRNYLYLLLLPFVFCAGTRDKDSERLVPAPIDKEMSLQLAKMVHIGTGLALYDLACGSAIDIWLTQEENPDFDLYFYYSPEDNVYFGAVDNNAFRTIGWVSFTESDTVSISADTLFCEGPLYSIAVCIAKTINMNASYYDSVGKPYNFWFSQNEDTMIIYSSPGYINDTYFLCGALQTKFTKPNLEMFRNSHIHEKLVALEFPLPSDADNLIRSSPKTSLPHEIDIAQSILLKKYAPTIMQYIVTNDYICHMEFLGGHFLNCNPILFKKQN